MIQKVLFEIWRHLVSVVSSEVFATWFNGAAELLVALVVYRELVRDRQANFIEEFNRQYWRRKRIYTAFVSLAQPDLTEHRKAFTLHIMTNSLLRSRCDEQIDHLNILWHTHSLNGRRELKRWLPHVVVRMWVMLGPYVLAKKAVNNGAWRDQNFIDFAEECLKLMSKIDSVGIEIWSAFAVVKIANKDLVLMRGEIKDR